MSAMSWGFYVFELFERVEPKNKMIDEKTVEIYVDEPPGVMKAI